MRLWTCLLTVIITLMLLSSICGVLGSNREWNLIGATLRFIVWEHPFILIGLLLYWVNRRRIGWFLSEVSRNIQDQWRMR